MMLNAGLSRNIIHFVHCVISVAIISQLKLSYSRTTQHNLGLPEKILRKMNISLDFMFNKLYINIIVASRYKNNILGGGVL